jgi:predicted DNA-binding protein
MAMPTTTIRMKHSDHQRLTDLAKANGSSLGEETRRALAAYLNGVDTAAMIEEQRRAMNEQIAGLETRLSARIDDHLTTLANAFATIQLVVDTDGNIVQGSIDEEALAAVKQAE